MEVARALDALAEVGLSVADTRPIRAVARRGSRLEEPLGEIAEPAERAAVVLGLLRLVLRLRAA